MGFALKPGLPHDNGIRNQHVKFEDGTELELLSFDVLFPIKGVDQVDPGARYG